MADQNTDRRAQPADGKAFLEEEHPGNRAIEPEDPMMVVAEAADGDPLVMLDGIIEEYARMGWDADQIKRLFEHPFFQATHALKQLLGEQEIHRRIEIVLKRCGVFHVTTSSLEMYDGR